MSSNGQSAKKGFRERFLVPVRSRIRSTSPPLSLPSPPQQPAAPNPAACSLSSFLHQAALQRLPEEDRAVLQDHISASPTSPNAGLDRAIEAARVQQQQYQDKRWTFTLGSRTIVLSDEADKIVRWLDRFKAVGDIVADVDPLHVGLPWAGVRLLLEITVTGAKERAALLVGCEMALFLSNRLKAYIEFYARLPQTQAHANFTDSLAQMHTCILGFLAQAIRAYQTSSAGRVVHTFWTGKDIADFEVRCDKLAMRVEVEASGCDRTLYRQLAQRAVDETKELHGLQTSLDRIETKIDLDTLNRLPYLASAEFDVYEADYKTCYSGTRLGVLRQITEWIQQPVGKRMFWLNDMAGTGKSTISYTVAEQLYNTNHSTASRLGSSLFFKRGAHDRNSARRLLRTIARRLAYQFPTFAPLLVKAVSAGPDIGEKRLGEQFDKLVFSPLKELSASMDRVGKSLILIVIVDALDECERHEDIRSLLKLWPRLAQLETIRLKLFLTGRPDFPVLKQMNEMPIDVRQDMALHDVPLTDVYQHITLYLRGQISQIREKFPSTAALGKGWPSAQNLQALVDLTVPWFIAATTACRFVGDNYWLGLKARLQTLLQSRSTHQLSHIENLYLTVLAPLTANCTEPDDKDAVYTQFRQIVGSIVTLAAPLSPRSLSKLMQLDLDDVQRWLGTMHAVLRVPLDPDTVVQTLHPSFREILLSTKSQSGPYRVNRKEAHHTLLMRCLDLLSGQDGLKEDMCRLQCPGQLRVDIDWGKIQRFLPAEIQYASENWVYHAKQCDYRIVSGDAVHVFLQRHFLHWLEASSLLGKYSMVIRALSDLKLMVSCDEALSAFFEDARRFILANRYVAELAPLQLYSSAVIFSPENSLVRQFCGRNPAWIQRLPPVSPSWGQEILVLRSLQGHCKYVYAIAFSTDGQLLASVAADSMVRLWDVSTGQEVQALAGHSSGVTVVAFPPHNSNLLVSGSSDSTVRLWDTSTGEQTFVLENHDENVTAVAFSPRDSRVVASASYDATIRIWSVSSGEELWVLKGHSASVNAVAFSLSDSNLLASASSDATVRLWDLSTRQELQVVEHTSRVNTVAFSPRNSQHLVSASDDNTIRLWDIGTGQTVWEQNNDCDGSTTSFSPNGQLLVVGTVRGPVKLCDPITGQELQTLEKSDGGIWAAAFSPDSKLLASASASSLYRKPVSLWDISTTPEVRRLDEHAGRGPSMTFSPNGQLLASASTLYDRTIRLLDVSTGQEIQALKNHAGCSGTVVFSPDSRLVAWASSGDAIRLWDTTTKQEVQSLTVSGLTTAITFSPDGQLLASASLDLTFRLWDVSTGQKVQVTQIPKDVPGTIHYNSGVTFSSTGKLVAFKCRNSIPLLYDLSIGKEIHLLPKHDGEVNALAFSPDDQLLAVASSDGTVELHDVSTGQVIQKTEHTPSVVAMAFSPTDRLLASAMYGGTVRLWDTSTLQEVQRFNHTAKVIAFSTDGLTLTTDQGTLHLDRALTRSATEDYSVKGHVTISQDWIQWDGQNLLWLSPDHHTRVYGDIIAFGLGSGRVGFLEFDYEKIADIMKE